MEIWLGDGLVDKIQLPVNPQSIGYGDSSNFEDIVLASGDEKTVVSGRNLRTVPISSFFPVNRASYVVSNKLMAPMEYVEKIKAWMDDRKVLRLQATQTNINMMVTIRSFNWEETGGTLGDIEYSLELKEYKPISYSVIKVVGNGEKAAPTTTNRPPSSKTVPKNHTVKAGENLWIIAKKYYNDGSKSKDIYNKNKSIIGKNPNLIKPGQKLVIP